MLNSRNESIDDSQSNPNNKSGINTMMYNTPAQTNLQPNGNHEHHDGRETIQSKIQIILGVDGASSVKDESNLRLEQRLKIKDLEMLKQTFDNIQSKSAKMNKQEFVSFLSTYLNKGTEEEYGDLFDNIDVTQSKTIDWDMFANYILIMLYESDDRIKAFSIPNWKPLKQINNVHRDSIRRIEFIKNFNRYLTISKEGSCCMYDKNSNMTNNAKINSESCKSKDLWVTDFVVLQNINKVVLAFTTKEISIYELSTKLDFNCQYRIYNLKSTPLCLDYWFDASNPNDSILIWGDTLGYIHNIHFNSTAIALFERPSVNVNSMKSSDKSANDTCLDIDINEIKDNYKNAIYLNYKAHTSWVRQVKWIRSLECVISCSITTKQSICFGWFTKKSSFIRVTHLHILNGGVNAFDFDEKVNLLATANQNTLVNLFNPYVNEPNGILKGHSRAVLAVKFMSSRSQLISFSADKILRIWNVPLQICIQRIANIFPKGPDVEITSCFDDLSNRFFISFRFTLFMMEIKPEVTDRIMTHSNQVVSVRFNKHTNQIFTLSQDGTIFIWLFENGQKVKTFSDLHQGSELTTMSFDETLTRIYTAGTDGYINIWDFNGHCYHSLEVNEGQGCEVTQIMPIKRRIIALGSRKITVFRDNTMKDFTVKPSNWNSKDEHQEDILCASIMKNPPMLLATGSFDGEIFIWNSVNESLLKRMNVSKKKSKVTRENTMTSLKTMTNRSSKGSRSSKRDFKVDSSDATDQDNDFGSSITCINFLNTRALGKDATLVSCGGNGYVRFWDVQNGKLISEFVAHQNVSSILMEINSSEKYIATGDVNGIVKVWNITEYCLNIDSNPDSSNLITNPPQLVSTIKSHSDCINSIDFCEKSDKIFVLIGSADCSASLNDINGNQIGILGQESHWKIEASFLPTLSSTSYYAQNNNSIVQSRTLKHNDMEEKDDKIENADKENILSLSAIEFGDIDSQQLAKSYDHLLPELNKKLNIEPTFEYEDDAFIKNTSLRYNPWSKTILGKSYQELRTNKRPRKQPSHVASNEFTNWEKTGQAPGGLYGSLEIVELENVKKVTSKNDRIDITNPQKYFRDKKLTPSASHKKMNMNLAGSLRSAFDEKSLFPKYILDYEARMKQEHKNALLKLNQESQLAASARTNGNGLEQKH